MKKKRAKKEVKKDKMNLEKLAVMVASGFSEMHDKFDQIDMKFEQVDKRFENVEQRLDGLDQKVNYLNNRMDQFADHGRRITRLERKMGASKI